MSNQKATVDVLAGLMQEFGLSEATLELGDVKVSFRTGQIHESVGGSLTPAVYGIVPTAPVPESQKGSPVTSPMAGIFYRCPTQSAPPYVGEGDSVTTGQVIAMIEAMKVFNEVVATISGSVLKIVAEDGQIVNPGDVLFFVG